MTDRRSKRTSLAIVDRAQAICRALLAGIFLAAAGCAEETTEPNKPVTDKALLDKLDSEDPDKFLEGVDEARDKYGKRGQQESASP